MEMISKVRERVYSSGTAKKTICVLRQERFLDNFGSGDPTNCPGGSTLQFCHLLVIIWFYFTLFYFILFLSMYLLTHYLPFHGTVQPIMC